MNRIETRIVPHPETGKLIRVKGFVNKGGQFNGTFKERGLTYGIVIDAKEKCEE